MVAYGRAIETENDHPVEKSDKEFNYVNKGLFRANAEVFLMYADKISATISVTYHSEDVLMRLTKVYFQAVKRTFDL